MAESDAGCFSESNAVEHTCRGALYLTPAEAAVTQHDDTPATAQIRTPSRPRSRDEVDALVLAHLGVAESIARRHSAGSKDWSDLRQVAYMGLVKAAQRFDPVKGEQFVSFAVPTIAGELKRYLRDCGWIVRPPRQVQELRGHLSTEIPRLTQALGRQPSSADLAAAMGQDLRCVEEALGAHNSMRPLSLDAPSSAEDGDANPFAELLTAEDTGLERAEMMATLASACRTLTARDRKIVYLRFFEEKTQQEIGRELGVTQMQISRLLTHILGCLRDQLLPDARTDTAGAHLRRASTGRRTGPRGTGSRTAAA